jgi:hypothetical protein
MYFIYANESGDTGLKKPGGTPFFVISGLIIHESFWNEFFQKIVDLRRGFHQTYGIPQRTPFHATDIVNGHDAYHHSQYGMTTADRFNLYREVLEFLAAQKGMIYVLNVFIQKGKFLDKNQDVFEWGWKIFLQRFHNTLWPGDAKAPPGQLAGEGDYGFLINDRTKDDKLRLLMRQMRAYNYIKSGKSTGRQYFNILATQILDDPAPRNSTHSYLVQMADMIAFALARRDFPRPKLAPYGFEKYFDILDPILLKSADKKHPQGIVYFPK